MRRGDDRSSCHRPSATTNTSQKQNNPALETGKGLNLAGGREGGSFKVSMTQLTPRSPLPQSLSLNCLSHYGRVAMFAHILRGDHLLCIDRDRIGRQRKDDDNNCVSPSKTLSSVILYVRGGLECRFHGWMDFELLLVKAGVAHLQSTPLRAGRGWGVGHREKNKITIK